jgi:hypothetical protein
VLPDAMTPPQSSDEPMTRPCCVLSPSALLASEISAYAVTMACSPSSAHAVGEMPVWIARAMTALLRLPGS